MAHDLTARAVLGPDGPLAKLWPGYEAREAQLLMADAVERALRGERRLLCEAGTGTGKTLAYLVPALLSGRRVIVSTATKALQEQIYTKDLPLLARLGLPADAALVKGMGNYVCLRRYHQLRASAESIDPSRAAALAAVERWLAQNPVGDLSTMPGSEAAAVRSEIAAASEARVGPTCVHHDACYVTQSRLRAQEARLLVVNHHLFFADLALRGPDFSGGVLPDYDAVIFDEAHQIEDIATEFFGVRVSTARFETLVRDAARAFGLGDSHRRPGLPPPDEIRRLVDSVSSASGPFFATVAALLGDDSRATVSPDQWDHNATVTYHRLDAALEALALRAESSHTEALAPIARRTTALRNDLTTVVEGARHRVLWGEATARGVSLAASPIRVAPMLRARLFELVGAVILTSATLAADDSFAYVRDRLGLDPDLGPVDELVLPSPFDHQQNSLLYVASGLPDPQDARFLSAAADHAVDLIRMSRGGAFVLCTSVRAMHAFHERLRRESFAPLLVQGEAPKTELLERFRAAGGAVLVATMSFWEGVDVPGHALRLVILDRLPFPVPTDPLVAARSAALAADGADPFLDFHVPAAAITLKQGFGRLIRTASDRGVVAVLDRRLVARRYGVHLRAALPPARVSEWPEDVDEFFARHLDQPPPDEDLGTYDDGGYDGGEDPSHPPPAPQGEGSEEGYPVSTGTAGDGTSVAGDGSSVAGDGPGVASDGPSVASDEPPWSS